MGSLERRAVVVVVVLVVVGAPGQQQHCAVWCGAAALAWIGGAEDAKMGGRSRHSPLKPQKGCCAVWALLRLPGAVV